MGDGSADTRKPNSDFTAKMRLRVSPGLRQAPVMAFMICLLLLGSACANDGRQSQNGTDADELRRQIDQWLINATDLPLNYAQARFTDIEDPVGVGRAVTYHGANPVTQSWVNVSQFIVVFPDAESSIAGYERYLAKAIPPAYADSWPMPPELEDLEARADQLAGGCYSVQIDDLPMRGCRIVGRYGTVVTELYANVFEDRWLTMAELRRLLERADARLAAARDSDQN